MNTTVSAGALRDLPSGFMDVPDALGAPSDKASIAQTLAWASEAIHTPGHAANSAPNAPQIPQPQMEFDSESMILLLQQLNHKISDLQMETAKERLLIQKGETDKARLDNVAKIEEAQAKQKDAEAAAKKSWWTSLFKAIASVVLSIVAVALAVVSFGTATAASVALVCLAVYMAAQSVADLTAHIINKFREEEGKEPIDLSLTSWIGKGVAAIAEECGASESACRWIQMGVSVGLQIGLAVASIALSFKAAADIAKGIEKGVETAEKILETTEKVAEATERSITTAMQAMKIFSIGGAIIDAGLGIGDGAIKIDAAEKTLDSRQAQADSKLFDAAMAKLRQSMQDQEEQIKKLIQALEESDSIISQMIASASDSRTQIVRNIA